jgi:D-inositol-3-phosphate glycosyltransferase
LQPGVLERRLESVDAPVRSDISATLLTGGFDRPYAFGLAMALASKGVRLDVIGSDAVDSPEMHITHALRFLNLQGDQRPDVSFTSKVLRLARYYARLIRYAAIAEPRIFHILWNNRLQLLDRTCLMLYYKLLGKKIVFTAHNVNAGVRDGNDSALNRLTLKIQYHLADHILVHTDNMKDQLVNEFCVDRKVVTTIPFGINNAVPNTEITAAEARRRLGIGLGERVILFFGAIRPYKGVEYLVSAFQKIAPRNASYRLIIAGEPKKESLQYLSDIRAAVESGPGGDRVIQRIEFIPDEETELYFKAADVLVLPYTLVYQSGVLFLAYSFGLPVIASDVGAFREDIIEAKTGFVCRPCDADDLSRSIETYFESELFRSLELRRSEIKSFAEARNSWAVVSDRTFAVYDQLSKS